MKSAQARAHRAARALYRRVLPVGLTNYGARPVRLQDVSAPGAPPQLRAFFMRGAVLRPWQQARHLPFEHFLGYLLFTHWWS